MKKGINDPLEYLQRLKPCYVRLFRIAHAIVGNLELSEYVFRSAMVEAYLRRREWQGRMNFQEGLEHTVRGVALVELGRMRQSGSFEEDWRLPDFPEPQDKVQRILYARLIRENEITQRIAALYYGCALSPKQIGKVLGISVSDVNGRIRRLTSRLLRSAHLSGQNGKRKLEDGLESLILAALDQTGEDVPEAGAIFRSFERDVDGARPPRTSVGRVVSVALKVAGALLLAFMLWLLAVLLTPNGAIPVPEAENVTVTLENESSL